MSTCTVAMIRSSSRGRPYAPLTGMYLLLFSLFATTTSGQNYKTPLTMHTTVRDVVDPRTAMNMTVCVNKPTDFTAPCGYIFYVEPTLDVYKAATATGGQVGQGGACPVADADSMGDLMGKYVSYYCDGTMDNPTEYDHRGSVPTLGKMLTVTAKHEDDDSDWEHCYDITVAAFTSDTWTAEDGTSSCFTDVQFDSGSTYHFHLHVKLFNATNISHTFDDSMDAKQTIGVTFQTREHALSDGHLAINATDVSASDFVNTVTVSDYSTHQLDLIEPRHVARVHTEVTPVYNETDETHGVHVTVDYIVIIYANISDDQIILQLNLTNVTANLTPRGTSNMGNCDVSGPKITVVGCNFSKAHTNMENDYKELLCTTTIMLHYSNVSNGCTDFTGGINATACFYTIDPNNSSNNGCVDLDATTYRLEMITANYTFPVHGLGITRGMLPHFAASPDDLRQFSACDVTFFCGSAYKEYTTRPYASAYHQSMKYMDYLSIAGNVQLPKESYDICQNVTCHTVCGGANTTAHRPSCIQCVEDCQSNILRQFQIDHCMHTYVQNEQLAYITSLTEDVYVPTVGDAERSVVRNIRMEQCVPCLANNGSNHSVDEVLHNGTQYPCNLEFGHLVYCYPFEDYTTTVSHTQADNSSIFNFAECHFPLYNGREAANNFNLLSLVHFHELDLDPNATSWKMIVGSDHGVEVLNQTRTYYQNDYNDAARRILVSNSQGHMSTFDTTWIYVAMFLSTPITVCLTTLSKHISYRHRLLKQQ